MGNLSGRVHSTEISPKKQQQGSTQWFPLAAVFVYLYLDQIRCGKFVNWKFVQTILKAHFKCNSIIFLPNHDFCPRHFLKAIRKKKLVVELMCNTEYLSPVSNFYITEFTHATQNTIAHTVQWLNGQQCIIRSDENVYQLENCCHRQGWLRTEDVPICTP